MFLRLTYQFIPTITGASNAKSNYKKQYINSNFNKAKQQLKTTKIDLYGN